MVEMPNPEERLRQYPFELSGGLRQRVMIAMALVCEPKLLIADEPTTALDVTIQAQILDVLDHLREQYSMATMLITHDMGVIAGRTDRVLVMYAGRKAEEGTTEEIFDEHAPPLHPGALVVGPEDRRGELDRACSRSPGSRPTSRRRSWAAGSPRGASSRPTSAARPSPRSPGERHTSLCLLPPRRRARRRRTSRFDETEAGDVGRMVRGSSPSPTS